MSKNILGLLGLSCATAYFGLAVLVMLLLLLFLFIFLGISAFAVSNTFGAMINSVLPLAAGIGTAKADSGATSMSIDDIKEVVEEAIEDVEQMLMGDSDGK